MVLALRGGFCQWPLAEAAMAGCEEAIGQEGIGPFLAGFYSDAFLQQGDGFRAVSAFPRDDVITLSSVLYTIA